MYCVEFHLLGQWQESLLRCRNIAIKFNITLFQYVFTICDYFLFFFVCSSTAAGRKKKNDEKRKSSKGNSK